MYKYLLILCLSINVSFAASGVKLIEYIVSDAKLGKFLEKQGIMGNDALQVQSYVASSLAALSKKSSGSVSRQELLDILYKLPVTGEEANLRRGLQGLLDQDVDTIYKKDLVATINNIITLANRYGKSVIITCVECVNEKLAKDGFKFGVEAIKNASTVKLLNDVLPKNPDDMSKFITGRMNRLKVGDYAKVNPKVVGPQDEKSLALFLAVADSPTPEQKRIVDAIKKLSTSNEKVNIIDPKNPHKFWKIVADDMTSEEAAGWAKTLEEVAAVRAASNDKLTAEEAFYRVLADKAQGDENLMAHYKTLKAKRCFFK